MIYGNHAKQGLFLAGNKSLRGIKNCKHNASCLSHSLSATTCVCTLFILAKQKILAYNTKQKIIDNSSSHHPKLSMNSEKHFLDFFSFASHVPRRGQAIIENLYAIVHPILKNISRLSLSTDVKINVSNSYTYFLRLGKEPKKEKKRKEKKNEVLCLS